MKEFFINHQVLGFMIMSIVVVVLVAGIKFPFKYFLTSKIKDEKKRKSINSLFTLLAAGIGIGAAGIYSKLTGTPFNIELSSVFSGMGLGAYSYYEMFRNWIKYLIECRKNKKQLKLDEVIQIADESKIANDGETDEPSQEQVVDVQQEQKPEHKSRKEKQQEQLEKEKIEEQVDKLFEDQ